MHAPFKAPALFSSHFPEHTSRNRSVAPLCAPGGICPPREPRRRRRLSFTRRRRWHHQRRPWRSGSGKRHDNNGTPCAINRRDRHNYARAEFVDLRTFRRIEINPANLAPQHYSSSPSATVAPHPRISAFNASSCSTASAHWYNSFSRCSSSAANKSATSLLRWRAGTTALNRAAKASGRLRRTCVMATPAIQIIPVQIFKPHRRPLYPYVPMPRVIPHERVTSGDERAREGTLQP